MPQVYNYMFNFLCLDLQVEDFKTMSKVAKISNKLICFKVFQYETLIDRLFDDTMIVNVNW